MLRPKLVLLLTEILQNPRLLYLRDTGIQVVRTTIQQNYTRCSSQVNWFD